MNTENSRTNESNRFIYQFTDKLNSKILDKNMTLAKISIYYTWEIVLVKEQTCTLLIIT